MVPCSSHRVQWQPGVLSPNETVWQKRTESQTIIQNKTLCQKQYGIFWLLDYAVPKIFKGLNM
jgi:hypothetical protein